MILAGEVRVGGQRVDKAGTALEAMRNSRS